MAVKLDELLAAWVAVGESLARVDRRRMAAMLADLDEVIRRTPRQWIPDGQVRQDLPGFLKRRATHVADHVETWLAAECRWTP